MGSGYFHIQFSGESRLGGAECALSIGYLRESEGMNLYVLLRSRDGLALQDLMAHFSPGSALPDWTQELPVIHEIRLQYAGDAFDSAFTAHLHTTLHLGGKDMAVWLEITAGSGESGRKLAFGGTVRLAGHAFRVEFLENERFWQFLLQYGGRDTVRLSYAEFAKALGLEGPYPDLRLDIVRPTLFYLQEAERKGAKKTRKLLGLGAGLGDGFMLSALPLVGEALGDHGAFGLEEMMVTWASGAWTPEDLQRLNASRPAASGLPALPEVAHPDGFNLLLSARMAGELRSFGLPNLNLAPASGDADTPATPAPTPDPGMPPIATDGPEVSWMPVGKQLGPVRLQRLGFSFKDGRLILLLDASMRLAGLEADFIGLGFGTALKWPPGWPDLYLSGLGLAFQRGGFAISGMLVRGKPAAHEEYVFYGSMGFQLPSFAVRGMGSYARLKPGPGMPEGGHSFFAFGAYLGMIGGPPVFFVTGIAAGFGINGTIRVPRVEEVRSFPLVDFVLGPAGGGSPNIVLANLIAGNWVASAPGQYWLALGLRFTSFKLIEGFVMALVGFGEGLEVALLGVAVLAWPNAANAIVRVELQVLAHFSSRSDVVRVEGRLTPASFLFDPSCRLSGGFAFHVWVRGAHAGDFVLTLGGYHPQFDVPAHYPRVPRVALDWKRDALTMHGEVYFALTPGAIMMGGRLEVLFVKPGILVEFKVWVDGLLQWAPFRYSFHAGVSLRVEVEKELMFVTLSLSLTIRAELKLYGPPFGGEVVVDLGFKSFTISFGEGKDAAGKPLPWSGNEPKGFVESFVPVENGALRPLSLRVRHGLVSEEGKLPLVSGMGLSVVLDSFFPLRSVQVGEVADDDGWPILNLGDGAVMAYAKRQTALSVQPMRVSGLKTKLHCMVRDAKGKDHSAKFGVVMHTKPLPGALWGEKDTNLLHNALTGFELQLRGGQDHKGGSMELQPLQVDARRDLPLRLNRDAGDGPTVKQHNDVDSMMAFFQEAGIALRKPGIAQQHTSGMPVPRIRAGIGQAIPTKVQ